MTARKEARVKLADRMAEVISPAPMLFIADRQTQLLTAELLIRDLIDLGWAPPAESSTEKIELAPDGAGKD